MNVTATQEVVRVATNGAVSVVLYDPTKIPGRIVYVVNDTTQAGTTTVTTAAGNIGGASSVALVGPGAWAIFLADGANYKVFSPTAGTVPLGSTVTGTDPIQIAGDSAAHDLSVPRTWRIKPGTGVGRALIWGGSSWAEGSDFGAQNIVTTGTLSAGATTLASLTVTGNLTVNGTTTHINSTVLDTADRLIHVNHTTGVVAVPSLIAGLEVERGSADGVTARDGAAWVWDEASSSWRACLNTAGDDSTIGADLAIRALSYSLGSSTQPIVETRDGGLGLNLRTRTTNQAIALVDVSTTWGLFVYNSGNPYFQAFGLPFQLMTTGANALRIAATGTGDLELDGLATYFRSASGGTIRANLTASGFRVGDGTAATSAIDVVGTGTFSSSVTTPNLNSSVDLSLNAASGHKVALQAGGSNILEAFPGVTNIIRLTGMQSTGSNPGAPNFWYQENINGTVYWVNCTAEA